MIIYWRVLSAFLSAFFYWYGFATGPLLRRLEARRTCLCLCKCASNTCIFYMHASYVFVYVCVCMFVLCVCVCVCVCVHMHIVQMIRRYLVYMHYVFILIFTYMLCTFIIYASTHLFINKYIGYNFFTTFPALAYRTHIVSLRIHTFTHTQNNHSIYTCTYSQ
jgi:hypothetical protein